MTRLQSFIHQVFNGNPVDMLIQGVAGAVGALVSVWLKVGPFVGIYIALVIVDTILGVRLSKREGVAFSWTRLAMGPGQKIMFTALILIATQFMEAFVPGEFLTQAVAAYMSTVLFLEALSKYDKLTGHNVLEFVRERVGGLLKKN